MKWHLAERTGRFTFRPVFIRFREMDHASFIWGFWIWRNWTISTIAQEFVRSIAAQIRAQKGDQ